MRSKAYNAELAITGAAPYYNDTQIQHYIDGDDPILYPNTNWFEQIIKPISAQHKYGVNIKGGSEKVSYFVQYNGQYQDGIYKKSATNYDQNSVRSNIDITVTDALKLGVSLDARQQHKNYSAFPSDNNGIFYITTKMKPTGAAYYPNGYLRSGTNPAVLVQDKTGYDRSTINTLNTTLTLGWDLSSITNGLTLNGSLAYDIYSKFNKNWNQNWQYYSYDEVTELFEEKTSSYYSSPTLKESQTNSHRTTINANLNYDRDFDGHHVTGLLGFEQSSYRRDYFTAGIKQYASDILDELFAGSADKDWYTINGNASETARRSFFGRLGYDWNSKYMFQLIARYDGSENFPKANRWGFFPGVSLGWRLSEEPFISDNFSWLTNLKLRASYGEQGNDKIDAFQYMTTYEYTSSNVYRSKFGESDVNFIIPGAVQIYFVQRMTAFLMEHGKKVIGWDEILDGGAVPQTIAMSYRGHAPAAKAMNRDMLTILTPNRWCYLDNPQEIMGDDFNIFMPIRKSYDYNPLSLKFYPDNANLSEDRLKYVLGVQGCLWGEFLPTVEKAFTMAYPRNIALAETAWTAQEHKDWDSFRLRLLTAFERLEQKGIKYSDAYYKVLFKYQPKGSFPKELELSLDYPFASIHYTLDGSEPTADAPAYSQTLLVDEGVLVKAAAIDQDGKMMGEVYSKQF